MPHLMKQYIKNKISQKLDTLRAEGILVDKYFGDHMIDSIYQTLCSEGQASYQVQLTENNYGRIAYHLAKRNPSDLHSVERKDQLIYFAKDEMRYHKINQLIDLN